ncbi:unnamed protein product, partial [Rotaria magnacalcarata]
ISYSIIQKFDFLTMVSDQQDKALKQDIPPYAGAPPYEGDTVITTTQPQSLQRHQHEASIKGGAGDSNVQLGCCILCLFTGGLSFPLWVIYCCLASPNS